MSNPNYKSRFDRRDFLRIAAALGGYTAASMFLEACAQAGLIDPAETKPESTEIYPSASPTLESTTTTDFQPVEVLEPTVPASAEPTTTGVTETGEEMGMAKIAFVKTTDRSTGVRKAIELLGINPAAGKKVMLKPNFNSADPTPGSTHPDVLRTLVNVLQEMGAQGITVGDRSGMGNTQAVMRNLGVYDLAGELGLDIVAFDDLEMDDWEEIHFPGSHWKQGFLFPRPCLDCDAIVQTCCLKTHRFGGVFTLSLKNSVGLAAKNHPISGYNYMNELHSSPNQRVMIAEINKAYTPALVVIDGVEAFISGGPDRGQIAYPELILAGVDRIALDAVGVAALRYHGAVFNGRIFEQEQIARAMELGLGVSSPEKIELISPDEESAAYSQQIRAELMRG